jgi:signal transduction histidine kinase/GAF domain-containing protein
MLRRTEGLIMRSSFAFTLISLSLISVSIILYLQNGEGRTLADWSYASLSDMGKYTTLASLTTSILAIFFTLKSFTVRLKETKKSLQQRNQTLEALALSNQQINKSMEIPAVMRALVKSAIKLCEATDGAAGLMKDGQMVFTEYCKDGTWVPINLSFPPGYGVPGWVIENVRPYLSNDAASDLQVIQVIREQLGFYNLLDTPIINADGELLGCFEIHNTKDRRPFDEHDIIALKGLSASVAIAIENARIIAEQKKSQDLLLESEEKFRSLFENSPTSLWEEDFSAVKLYLDDIHRQGVSDLNSFFSSNPEAAQRCTRMVRIIDVNQKTIELFSARSKSDLLSHLDLVFCEKSLEPFIQGLIAMAEGEKSYKVSGINKTLNNEELELNVQASIMPGYEDSWGKVIVSMTDITSERETDRLKNEFISTAAHELRTPLTVIMGYSDLMLEHLETTEFSIEQKKEFLHNINDKVIALERIVEDLLDVSKIESGRPLLLEKAPAKLAKLIEELAKNHQRETNRHQITTNFDNQNLLTMVDAGRITQVIDNLINNAIKYSPDGGNIKISCNQDHNKIEISVEDHGLGMTKEQSARIFDKFYRADTSDTALSGLGLGMSIAKNIIEAHGGSIWIESVPGKGTTVHFTLPLQTQIESYFTQEIAGSSQIH